MARILALSLAAASLAAAAPEPQITARAELHPRADSSILGYISTSGASQCNVPTISALLVSRVIAHTH